MATGTTIRGGAAAMRTQWGLEAKPEAPDWNGVWQSHYISDDGEVGLGLDAPLIPAGVLRGDQQEEVGDNTKIDVLGAVPVKWEPHGLFRYFGQFQRNAATPVVLTGGQSWRHKLAPSESDEDLDLPINAQIWQADGLPQMYSGLRVTQFVIALNERQKASGAVTLEGMQASFWGVAVPITEDATPERPVVMGLPTYANWILADHDLYIKVQTAATNTIQVKIGAAAAYSNTQVVVDGEWLTLLDEAGDPIGELDSPTQLYVGDTSAWADNDEWRIPGKVVTTAVPWTENLPVIKSLNEIHATITIDLGSGAEERILRQVTITGTSPHTRSFGLGGRWCRSVDPDGVRNIAIAMQRRYLDTDLYQALIAGQAFELDVILSSRILIGSSADPYRIRLVMPNCRAAGRGPRVSGPSEIVENIAAVAYNNDGDATHPDDLTVYLDNAISDLTAA